MRIFTPSFSFFFLFFFKKVHTLAGHYKCGQYLQKVYTYIYIHITSGQQPAVYIKKCTPIYAYKMHSFMYCIYSTQSRCRAQAPPAGLITPLPH